MKIISTPRLRTALFIGFVFMFLVAGFLIKSPASAGAVSDDSSFAPTSGEGRTVVSVVDLPVWSIAYDPRSSRIFAAVKSSDATRGNSIVAINPQTLEQEPPVYVGSEPKSVALTNDGQSLYVGLYGAGAIRRFDIPTRSAQEQISLGSDPVNGAYRFSDIAAAPDDPNVVAVPRSLLWYSPRASGMSILDKGVARPSTGVSSIGRDNPISFGDDSSQIFGLPGLTTLDVINVDANGAELFQQFPISPSTSFSYSNGVVYTNGLQAIDARTGAVRGQFRLSQSVTGGNLVPDPASGRLYYVGRTALKQWSISAFDTNDYSLDGSVSFSSDAAVGQYEGIKDVVRWGDNGIAFVHDSKLFVVQTTLVNPNVPVVPPPATPAPTPTPTPANHIRRIPIVAAGLVYNPVNSSFYATVGSQNVAAYRNSVVRINPIDGSVGGVTPVGDGPSMMALSDDGDSMYVKLDGSSAVREFSALTQRAGATYSFAEASNIKDLFVPDGSPDTFVAALGPLGAAVYDNGVRRPVMTNGGAVSIDQVEPSASPTAFFGYNQQTYDFDLGDFTLDAAGVRGGRRTGNLVAGFQTVFKAAGGLVFSSQGAVIDAASRRLLGTCDANGTSVEVNVETRRIYIAETGRIKVFDMDSYRQIGSIDLPLNNGTVSDLTRWGTNGLGFRFTGTGSPNGIYFVSSPLIGAGNPPRNVRMFVDGQLVSNARFSESSGIRNLDIRRFGDLSAPMSLKVATESLEARAGEDFVPIDTTITFAPGEDVVTLPLQIIDDELFENDERFTVVLRDIAGADDTEPVTTGFTIANDDSMPTVSAADIVVDEPPPGGQMTARFNIVLNKPTAFSFNLSYCACGGNGSATRDLDYIPSGRNIVVPAGTTSIPIDIVVNGDLLREPDETFVLQIDTPYFATTNLTPTVTATIRNYNANGRAKFDFDGDNRSDVSVFRPSSGEWWITRSGDNSVTTGALGTAGDVIVAADYTGDGKADSAVWRPSTGEWFVNRSEDSTYYSVPFGQSGDIPAASDYDGDGRIDFAVFRPSNGTWYIAKSSGGVVFETFGVAGDRPVAADYDGDGLADIAVFRPSTGAWWILQSSTRTVATTTFGISTDIPVAADFSGSGRADVAVFRPSEGNWYVLRRETGEASITTFGASGDIPAPGDYDGDGRADFAVFRPSEANWYINRVNGAPSILQFGLASDVPVAGIR